MRTKLSICIPAFNEAPGVKKTLEELRSSCPEAEIILVDDGSTDETLNLAKSVEGIVVLSHSRNRGYGAALKTAIRSAKGEVIAWFDADGQHRTVDLDKVIKPVFEGHMDAVIGTRGKDSEVSMDRLPGKLALKFISELLVGETIPDLNSGLRCFRADVIGRYLHLLPDGFSASTTSTLLMMKRGYRLGFVDIVSIKRRGHSNVNIFSDGLTTLKLIIRTVILFNAFAFFTILSMLQIIPGLIYGIYLAFMQKLGFPVLASTVIISGVLTFFMGLICDQITELRKERFES
jgi:glycosyltransferase involved in cell wall biosynthesis